MEQKNNKTSETGEVQVFELTMDNPEDQDELNRRLRKPGEPDRAEATQVGSAGQSEAKTEYPKSGPG